MNQKRHLRGAIYLHRNTPDRLHALLHGACEPTLCVLHHRADTGTVSISVNLQYESGAVGTMTLGIGPMLEAMVFIKSTNNQAIQVFETRLSTSISHADVDRRGR